MLYFLGLTFLLGAGFVAMEVNEFVHLAQEGYKWITSGGASAFFPLVGTHGFRGRTWQTRWLRVARRVLSGHTLTMC